MPDKESAVRAKHKGIFILFVLRVFMDVPGHEFTRSRNRTFKKCKLEVVGGCLCWCIESSDVVIPDNDRTHLESPIGPRIWDFHENPI